MPEPTPANDAELHTRSWRAFERNLHAIMHFVAISKKELNYILSTTTRISKRLDKPRETVTTKNAFSRSLRRYTANLTAHVERVQTIKRWQVVMLVTCVEAYLQDVFALAASLDPKLMEKSEQVAAYADVVSAASLETLANELRNRWARGWVNDGGPSRWIDRLERMGARGYSDGLAARLELFWGIRHVVVHAAGFVTPDFMKRHPQVTTARGELVSVSSADYGSFVHAVRCFVEPTEKFFLARYPESSSVRAT